MGLTNRCAKPGRANRTPNRLSSRDGLFHAKQTPMTAANMREFGREKRLCGWVKRPVDWLNGWIVGLRSASGLNDPVAKCTKRMIKPTTNTGKPTITVMTIKPSTKSIT
jgi:hypothetical protein